jgi:SYP7 family syntaxin
MQPPHRYEKYDIDAKKLAKSAGQDEFTNEVDELQAAIDSLMSTAAEVALMTNRAEVASKNAEIRRVKNVLLNEAIPSVEKLAKKDGKKKIKNPEKLKERDAIISDLMEKIYAIPDGMSSKGRKRPTRYNRLDKKNQGPVLLDMDGAAGDKLQENPLYWQENEETQTFEKSKQARFKKQDEQLDRVANIVDRLGEVATNMGEALDRQDPVIDEIDHQVNKHTANLKQTNIKLKAMVEKMAKGSNFCVYVILIVILLAIGGVIYGVVRK